MTHFETHVFDILPCLHKYYLYVWRSWAIVDYVVIPLIVVDLYTFHKAPVITVMENNSINIHYIRLWRCLVCVYEWTTTLSLEQDVIIPAVCLIFSSRVRIGLRAVSLHHTHSLLSIFFRIRLNLEYAVSQYSTCMLSYGGGFCRMDIPYSYL